MAKGRATDNSGAEQQTHSQLPTRVKFEYVKGNHFRVVHADGAFGGLTPNGNIQMAVFSQRGAFPNFIEQEILDGKLGDEISRQGKDWVIRELEVDLVMSIDTARGICAWLEEKIRLLESADE